MTDDSTTPDDDRHSGTKGRATPSRKEAEAARKQQMKQPLTRKERMMRERKAREELRMKQREALNTGRGDLLPRRDQGPVRAFTRDYVDRRRNVAEYLLPVLVFILLISILGFGALMTLLWSLTIVSTIFDEFRLVRGLKKELKVRFPDTSVKGSTSYAVLRSTQLRRFRLPKPAIERGGPLKARY